ncbi:MAG: hypothetical protein JJ975_13460 [Bacteroidia bacterium]|nr:hypothetical protein [Bacteroidia bacterium]
MRIVLGLIFSLVTLIFLWINFQLYRPENTPNEERQDIRRQLNFLEEELKTKDLGSRMQSLFPEGYVFVNALYGLTWCELALADHTADSTRNRAIEEALYAYKQLDSDKGRSVFNSDLSPPYGIFYQGWKNYLLAKMLQIDGDFDNRLIYEERFKKDCEEIGLAMEASSTPFLSSYLGMSWPADICVAVASLSNYDNMYEPTYRKQIEDWLTHVKALSDSSTVLWPHETHWETGVTLQGPRGSSTSLMIRMLSEVDSNFAQMQYKEFSNRFVQPTFGLPSVREYPKGQLGEPDVDSGPVLFGVGFSGTIVTIALPALVGNYQHCSQQYRTINAFGFGTTNGHSKRYLFGVLPMADAFIAWGRASALHSKGTGNGYTEYRPWKFTLITLGFICLMWGMFFARRIKKWLGRDNASNS